MQEEVENRAVMLIINTAQFTGRTLQAAISKYLAYAKEKSASKSRAGPVIPRGKQTVRQLVGQNAGVSNIEVNDQNIKSFERIARKYGVDFAIKKDRSVAPPKYLVFFKARDADALTSAFTEFAAKTVNKTKKPSILAQLHKFTELVKSRKIDRVKHREQERSL